MSIEMLIIPLSLVAFVLKGVAGFGPGIVLVPVGAVLFGVVETVVVVGLLDLISNAVLFVQQRDWQRWRVWSLLALVVILASAIGAIALTWLPAAAVEFVLGAALLPFAVWFLFFGEVKRQIASSDTKVVLTMRDYVAAAVSGIAGGLVGVTGPALAATLAGRMSKVTFRHLVVPVFLCSALARTGAYGGGDLIDEQVLYLTLLALPGLVIGIPLGNRVFVRISERWFRRVLGALMGVAGARLIT